MKHLNKFHIICSCVVVLMILLGVILFCHQDTRVSLIREESFFSDFKVRGEEVFIKCHLTLSNSGKSDVRVRMEADMSEDVAGGLLAEPVLYAYDKNKQDIFLIPAQSEKEYDVNFIGKFAGREQKQNRSLPDIKIREVRSGDNSERR